MIIRLKNPYAIDGNLNALLRFYVRYFNSPQRMKALRYINYIFHLVARVWGFIKLKRGNHSFMLAKYEGGPSFTIRDTNSQFRSIYSDEYSSVYEPDVSSVIELFLKPGDVFVDVGSNWGHHSFYAIMEKGAFVVAFEPNPSVADDVRRIANEMGVNEKIEVNCLALSDIDGVLELKQNFFESGVASIDGNFSNERKSEKYISMLHRLLALTPITYEAKVVTLDSLNLSKVELIKIDVEGVELEVLRGAKETIERHSPIICFEFHSGDLSTYEAFEVFFSRLDYQLFEVSIFPNSVDIASYKVELRIVDIGILKAYTQYNLIATHRNFQL